MGLGPLKGPTKMRDGMTRRGPSNKNVNSRRRNKPSNAGTRTEPLKGPDKGRG